MILIQKPREVIGGLVVIAIGAGFFLSGQELEMGTSFRMGPGYFPTILSILMIGLGALRDPLIFYFDTLGGCFDKLEAREQGIFVHAKLPNSHDCTSENLCNRTARDELNH